MIRPTLNSSGNTPSTSPSTSRITSVTVVIAASATLKAQKCQRASTRRRSPCTQPADPVDQVTGCSANHEGDPQARDPLRGQRRGVDRQPGQGGPRYDRQRRGFVRKIRAVQHPEGGPGVVDRVRQKRLTE